MIKITKPAINLREVLSRVMSMTPRVERRAFQMGFDGAQTRQYLPYGWKPVAAYLDGIRQFVGNGEQVVFGNDGFAYWVEWDVAPSNTSTAHIDVERNYD